MTLDAGLLDAIGRGVYHAGGDFADVEDLVWVWGRVERCWGPRVDAMRREAQTVRCSCADGGEEPVGGRCQRCYGRVEG